MQMVDRGERKLAGGGQALGGAEADEQRRDEPGPARGGDQLDVVEACAGGRSASSITGGSSVRWWREAISGTTPPKRSCTPWDEITLARISPSALTSAAQVSSQLVSIARITLPPRAVRVRAT